MEWPHIPFYKASVSPSAARLWICHKLPLMAEVLESHSWPVLYLDSCCCCCCCCLLVFFQDFSFANPWIENPLAFFWENCTHLERWTTSMSAWLAASTADHAQSPSSVIDKGSPHLPQTDRRPKTEVPKHLKDLPVTVLFFFFNHLNIKTITTQLCFFCFIQFKFFFLLFLILLLVFFFPEKSWAAALAKRGMRKVMVRRRAAPRREGSLVTQPCLQKWVRYKVGDWAEPQNFCDLIFDG